MLMFCVPAKYKELAMGGIAINIMEYASSYTPYAGMAQMSRIPCRVRLPSNLMNSLQPFLVRQLLRLGANY